MIFRIYIYQHSPIIGAIQGNGGECATLSRAMEHVNTLQMVAERTRSPRSVYIKRDFDPITGAHERMDVDVTHITRVEEV